MNLSLKDFKVFVGVAAVAGASIGIIAANLGWPVWVLILISGVVGGFLGYVRAVELEKDKDQ